MKIEVFDNQIEAALKQLKKQMLKDGVFQEMKTRRPGEALERPLQRGEVGQGEDRDHEEVQARRRGAGAPRPREPQDHRLRDPGSLMRLT
ncbi:MAG: 30S ribosomal protein S21 [Candidatus Rokuibacteriota bacterium]|nr:MAG: 30S ribosomal protein S21 [Candidatus Rokubacteria bacterium]